MQDVAIDTTGTIDVVHMHWAHILIHIYSKHKYIIHTICSYS